LLDLLDISPIGGGSIPKLFIYIVWGLNAAIFLGEDIINEHIFDTGQVVSISSASSCTVLKKVNADADLFENIEVVNSNEFFVISSYDCELVTIDVIKTRKSRAPPVWNALA
jgi:hypothetical protein